MKGEIEEEEDKNSGNEAPFLNNVGPAYSKEDHQFFMKLVARCVEEEKENLEKQSEFIQFFASQKYGKHVQVFIFDYRKGRSGHLFYSNLGEYIELKYKKWMYFIWRIKLL